MIPQFSPLVKPEYAEAVKDQILSGWIGSGKCVSEFEKAIADLTGAEYAIATSSGTTALLASLVAVGIKSGDMVAVSDYSFIAAVNAVRFLGAIPVLIDISLETLCLNPTLLAIASPGSIKAVIFIDHNGYVGRDAVAAKCFCLMHNIPLIEDAACALCQWDSDMFHAGRVGDLGCFSFSVPKLITTGQGGMIITSDKSMMIRCREIVDQGSTTWREDGLHKNIGLNFKLSNIAASYGLAQMKYIDELCAMRYRNYLLYLENGVDVYCFNQGKPTGPWMNIVFSHDADLLIAELARNGVQAKKTYRPAHDSCIGNVVHRGEKFKSTEAADCLVYLPSSLGLKEDEIELVAKIYRDCEHGG